MNATRPIAALLVGGLITLAITTSLLRTRYQLDRALESVHLQTGLRSGAEEIEVDLEGALQPSGRRAASEPSHPWQSWELDQAQTNYVGGNGPPLPATMVARALASHPAALNLPTLLGLFATDTGSNALLVVEQVPGAGSTRKWVGSWKFVDGVVLQPGVVTLIKEGYRVQLYDIDTAAALYQSDAGSFVSPTGIPLHFGASRLALKALRGNGWAAPLELSAPLLLLALGFLLWLCHELRHRQALGNASSETRDALAQQTAINLKYDRALESLASLEARLQISSLYDTTTGLANRASLVRSIDSSLDTVRQNPDEMLWVMTIGFGHMPRLMSSLGADVAARAMVSAIDRVRPLLPSKELLFRASDSHLAVMLPGGESSRTEHLAERIIDALDAPITVDTHTLLLHPSIGMTRTTTGYERAETLLDEADAALAAIRFDASRRYCLFDSSTTKESTRRMQLEADFGRAFDEGQFILEYEPFVLPVAHTVVGFEALIRWEHPTEGRLSPAEFLPIAEQAGLMHRFDKWVMRQAVRQVGVWRGAGYSEVFVNFNLSAEAFARGDLVDEVSALLAEFDVPGSQVVIELTESTLLRDLNAAADTLKDLGEFGVNAWLDDFGTGYSSLSHLRVLPLKGVKLDRTFIERIEIDARDFGLVKALIDLINYLGMQSVAEGIETTAQCELLSLTTCDLYQGYYFSRSITAEQAERLLRERIPLVRVQNPSTMPEAPARNDAASAA